MSDDCSAATKSFDANEAAFLSGFVFLPAAGALGLTWRECARAGGAADRGKDDPSGDLLAQSAHAFGRGKTEKLRVESRGLRLEGKLISARRYAAFLLLLAVVERQNQTPAEDVPVTFERDAADPRIDIVQIAGERLRPGAAVYEPLRSSPLHQLHRQRQAQEKAESSSPGRSKVRLAASARRLELAVVQKTSWQTLVRLRCHTAAIGIPYRFEEDGQWQNSFFLNCVVIDRLQTLNLEFSCAGTAVSVLGGGDQVQE